MFSRFKVISISRPQIGKVQVRYHRYPRQTPQPFNVKPQPPPVIQNEAVVMSAESSASAPIESDVPVPTTEPVISISKTIRSAAYKKPQQKKTAKKSELEKVSQKIRANETQLRAINVKSIKLQALSTKLEAEKNTLLKFQDQFKPTTKGQSAFSLFIKNNFQKASAEAEKANMNVIAYLSKQWKQLSPAEKMVYTDQALKNKPSKKINSPFTLFMIQEWNKIKEEQQKKNSKADFATFQPKIVKQWKEMQDEEKNRFFDLFKSVKNDQTKAMEKQKKPKKPKKVSEYSQFIAEKFQLLKKTKPSASLFNSEDRKLLNQQWEQHKQEMAKLKAILNKPTKSTPTEQPAQQPVTEAVT